MKFITIAGNLTSPVEEYNLVHRPGTYLVADKYTLQLDLDSEEALEEFHRRLPFFKRNLARYSNQFIISQYERPSETPGHWHVILRLHASIDNVEDRIFLQLCLGSDPKRELLSWYRVKSGVDNPILLDLVLLGDDDPIFEDCIYEENSEPTINTGTSSEIETSRRFAITEPAIISENSSHQRSRAVVAPTSKFLAQLYWQAEALSFREAMSRRLPEDIEYL